MPTILEEIQDRENIISYARAIYRGARTVIQKAAEGYDGLINPSRGANPIAYGIVDVIKYLAETDENARKLAQRISFGLSSNHDHIFPVVPVPLTADIKMEEEELAYYGLSLDGIIDGIRVFGADVIKTLSYPPEQRLKEKNFRLLDWLFLKLEGRENVSRFYRELPAIQKPVFIDTAISGRAASTILREFDAIEFHVYPIIFSDTSKELLPIHKSYFLGERQKTTGLDLIEMRRNFTEDQGAAFLGVYAVFYPQILLQARNMGLSYTSAVTWHDINENTHDSNIPYKETFNSLMELLTTTARTIAELEKDLGEGFDGLKDNEVLDLLNDTQCRTLDTGIQKVSENIDRYKVPKTESGTTIRREFSFPIESANETRSHVIHIRLKKDFLDNQMRDLRNYLTTI